MTTYTGAFPAPAAWVFARLPDAADSGLLSDPLPGGSVPPLPDDYGTWTNLDREIVSITNRLQSEFPVLTTTTLSLLDTTFLAEATGLLVAARLMGPATTGGANGELILEKTDTTTRQFSQAGSKNVQGERDRWIYEAAQALRSIKCIHDQTIQQTNLISLSGANGPRRLARSYGYPRLPLTALVNVLRETAFYTPAQNSAPLINAGVY